MISFIKKTPPKVEMDFIGNPEVIKNILKKKKDPHSTTYKTVAVFPGGGQRGVIQGGAATAFEKLDLQEAFDYMVGISAGACAAYYFLAGEAAYGTSIYFNENIQNHFVNFFRPWKLMDVKIVEKAFQDHAVDPNLFKNARTTFIMGVTDADTGKERYINIKNADSPLKCLVASISIPLATDIRGGHVEAIEGHACVDGCAGNPLPIQYAIDHLGGTDVLVVLTKPLFYPKIQKSFVQKLLNKTIYRELSDGLRQDIIEYEDKYADQLQYITGEKKLPKGVRLGVIYPKIMPVQPTTMNRILLEETAAEAMKFTHDLFLKYKN